SDRLNSASWVNETLQFTHGYGLVMNPVNEVTENGQPRFIASGLPLQASDPKLIPQRPQIYYGELTTRPVVAPSQTEEFDVALEEQKAVSRFDGRTGLPLGSFGARPLFAAYLHAPNLV